MTEPEYLTYDEYKIRKQKLDEIRELGMEPYPHHYTPSVEVTELVEKYSDGQDVGSYDEAASQKTEQVTVAGRVVLHRAMGKNLFAQIQEGESRIQILCNRDAVSVNGLPEGSSVTPIKFIEKKIDLGDIIGVTGNLFRTQKGELTIFVSELTLLTKTLLPLPDKHCGLTDKEVRYRKRWIDMIANPEVLSTFRMRSKIFSLMREYFENARFMEVETPVLEGIYGGAQAKPFKSHLNALHKDMYMRIALEISLKKLIVGGISRVFEMGKLFRNEGLDSTHNPEFSMVECYAAYWDYNDVMTFTENMYAFIANRLFGSTKLGQRMDRHGVYHDIDLKTPWPRISMVDSIEKFAKIRCIDLSDEEMRKLLLEKTDLEPKKVKEAPRGILISMLFEEFVEQHLIQPHFIIDHPIETTPLCKPHRNPELAKQGIVERFEGFILGTEICNAYTELNDPILQRRLLQEQERLLEAGDEEASPMDEEFLEAICQGMPPCGGLGVGLDRMIMLFANQRSIRDVIFFPLMR